MRNFHRQKLNRSKRIKKYDDGKYVQQWINEKRNFSQRQK